MSQAPSYAPHHASKVAWYYEDKGSLDFVVEHRNPNGDFCGIIRFRVKASHLRKSLAAMARRKKAKR